MNLFTILLLIAALLCLALLAAPFVAPFAARLHRARGLTLAANVGPSGVIPGGRLTKLAGAAIALKFLLLKRGGDDAHFVKCSAATDKSLGVSNDSADAAEDPIVCLLHGGAPETRQVLPGAAIAIGDRLVPDASAKAQPLPAGAGTYWVFGMAIEAAGAASDEWPINYMPCTPYPVVVS